MLAHSGALSKMRHERPEATRPCDRGWTSGQNKEKAVAAAASAVVVDFVAALLGLGFDGPRSRIGHRCDGSGSRMGSEAHRAWKSDI